MMKKSLILISLLFIIVSGFSQNNYKEFTKEYNSSEVGDADTSINFDCYAKLWINYQDKHQIKGFIDFFDNGASSFLFYIKTSPKWAKTEDGIEYQYVDIIDVNDGREGAFIYDKKFLYVMIMIDGNSILLFNKKEKEKPKNVY